MTCTDGTYIKVILFYKDLQAGEKYTNTSFLHIYTSNGYIYVKNKNDIIKLMHVSEIPITQNGLIECNIENCLSAVAALYGLKVPLKNIIKGLKTFKDNNGRFHLFDMNNYKIMLDYAHNIKGYENVLKVCEKLSYKRLVGIIGMPGDRSDHSITEVGKICSCAFDEIYIKEDVNPRGRRRGEVAQLLYDAITKCEKYNSCKIVVKETEVEALKEAVAYAQDGVFILVLYEELDSLMDLIDKARMKSRSLPHAPRDSCPSVSSL